MRPLYVCTHPSPFPPSFPSQAPVPDDLKAKAAEYRAKTIELAVEQDEDALNAYLEGVVSTHATHARTHARTPRHAHHFSSCLSYCLSTPSTLPYPSGGGHCIPILHSRVDPSHHTFSLPSPF